MDKQNPPSVGIVSLGCSKALVDSEEIVNRLISENIKIVPSYEEADLILVNTCGFINSAITESLETIKEAKKKNGKVVVTGCLGAKKNSDGSPIITAEELGVISVTGPDKPAATAELIKKHLNLTKKNLNYSQYKKKLPSADNKKDSFFPSSRNYLLTPPHYAYLKISEGCNQNCTFCIIPSMRGKLNSRRVSDIIHEAKTLVAKGVKEIIVISQDTGAYGADSRYHTEFVEGFPVNSSLFGLVKELQKLKIWVRLHYIYPYPNIDKLIPLMVNKKDSPIVTPSRNGIVPYIDIPFQHAHPEILKKMKRPGNMEKILNRLSGWRQICPDLTIRSTFIVGFPGEEESHFNYLLEFLTEAKLDRVGCFSYSPVDGAKANSLPDHVCEELKLERKSRLLQHQEQISKNRLKRWCGKHVEVIIEGIDEEEEVLIGRGPGDSPEIDGIVKIYPNLDKKYQVEIGDFSVVEIIDNDEHDLIARFVGDTV